MAPASCELKVPGGIVETMIGQARRERPLECCGLLGGVGDEVRSIYPIENEAKSATQFLAAGALLEPFMLLRTRREELLAIYHSHPASLAVPSSTDLARNYYGNTIHIIISLAGPEPVVRAYRLGKDDYTEIRWNRI